jgi:hypothetical protein
MRPKERFSRRPQALQYGFCATTRHMGVLLVPQVVHTCSLLHNLVSH